MRRILIPIAGLLFAGSMTARPDDLEDSYAKLQSAVAGKDAAQVKELSSKLCGLARAAAAKPAPPEESDKALWEKQVAYAKELESYSEYALYATAIQSPPAATVELMDALVAQNPKSKYLAMGYGLYLSSLDRSGQAARIPVVAQKGAASFPDDDDLQMVLAEYDVSRNQLVEAGPHAEKLLLILPRHPVPEGMSGPDWERKKEQALGRAYWIAGQAHSTKAEYNLADQDLRNALPRITANGAMLAAAYFQLGVANYHLGRQGMNATQVLEAASFSDKAAAIRGPYQQQAWTNANAMRREAAKMRGAK
ncbi:MAG: hypothetical protein HY821_17455 [Acidobacteria bacterium]|nr:hypothetical protein [Acidobacteriota bacterium]